MSGKGSRNWKQEGNWRCDKCNNLNFGWRVQCFKCKTRKSEKGCNEDGLGVGTALLVGAGAAAVGFLAQGLWNAFQGSSSSSQEPPPPSAGKSDNDTAERQKLRTAFREQYVPKDMKCAVCLVNPREISMLPCGHIYLCEDCAEEVKTKCPMCQEPITGKKPIYM